MLELLIVPVTIKSVNIFIAKKIEFSIIPIYIESDDILIT